MAATEHSVGSMAKSPTTDTKEHHSNSSNASDIADVPKPHLHAKTFLAVSSVGLIYFVQLVCLVGAGAQGQTISGHFNRRADVLWLTAPIAIFTVVLGPIVSQASDYWGRKWFLIILSLIGAVGCVIVARATSMSMVIAGFCVIGISFGAQPLLHTVTSEVLPRRYRSYGQASNMISNCAGCIVGLLVGGALNRKNDPTSNGFRYYYYMAMASYVLAVLLCFVSYNPPPTEKQREFSGRNMDKLKKLDWVGYFLLAAGLVLFCVGLSWSQNPYPWSDPHVSATFAVGLVIAIALIVYESWFKSDGMFHHGLFNANRNFALAVFCVFCEGMAFFAANIYFAFQTSVLYETDALLVGARYSVSFIACIIGAAVTSVYCAVTKRARWVTVLAFVIFVAYFVCLATANRSSNEAVWGYTVLMGVALGMTLTTLITVAQLCVAPQLISIASGLIISVRSLGGTIGIAIYNAIFLDKMNHMPANIAKAAISSGLDPDSVPNLIAGLNAHNETMVGRIPGINPDIIGASTIALLDTYVVAFRYVWVAAGCFVFLGAISAAFLFDPKKEFTMRVDAPVEKEEELYN